MYRELLVITALSTAGFGSILDGDLDIADGVKLVSIPVSNSLEDEGRGFGENSPLFRMAKFLQGHELRVKLPDLIEKDKIRRILEFLLITDDKPNKDTAVIGRGDGGGVLSWLLKLVTAKTLGVVGLAGMVLVTLKMPFDFIYYVNKYGL